MRGPKRLECWRYLVLYAPKMGSFGNLVKLSTKMLVVTEGVTRFGISRLSLLPRFNSTVWVRR